MRQRKHCEEKAKVTTAQEESRTRSTPIDIIAFYKQATPDWRKMHRTKRPALVGRACLPLCSRLTMTRPTSASLSMASQEASNRNGALFFSADALCVCTGIHLFLVVSCALCSNATTKTCLKAHYGAFCDDKVDANDNEEDDDDDIKIDIEFVKRYLKSLHSQMKINSKEFGQRRAPQTCAQRTYRHSSRSDSSDSAESSATRRVDDVAGVGHRLYQAQQ
jgi:hypothetical protein